MSVPDLKSWQANNAYANIFGYVRGDVNYKLLHMLNYGNIIPNNMASLGIGNSNYRWWNRQAPLASDSGIVYSQMYNFNMNVNIFPLAAYQKIYQDFSVGLNGKTLILLLIILIGIKVLEIYLVVLLMLLFLLAPIIGNVIIYFLFVIVIGIRICLWVFFRILSLEILLL